MTEQNSVRCERSEGGVCTLFLDRQKRANALTRAQLELLPSLVEQADREGSTAIVLIGAGPWFSAGLDLDELEGTTADAWVDEALAGIHETVAGANAPVIAAVEGSCIGAGLDLALAADVIIAGAGARFALPAARFGLLYRTEVVRKLVQRTGPDFTLRLLAFGQDYDAAEAQRSGLVGLLVESGEAHHEACELARAASQASLAAVAASKHLVRDLCADTQVRDDWNAVRTELDESPERKAAVAAARDKHNT
jgi:enoyl-CoA hydratase/carnithine racemase